MDEIIEHFKEGFQKAIQKRSHERRIGAELKFPMVDEEGNAVCHSDVKRLWKFLGTQGWRVQTDPFTSNVVEAAIAGPKNDTIASCETGFCKVEFSLAHVADIHALSETIHWLRGLLREFSDKSGRHFLGFGLQPKTPPSRNLKMEKTRNVFWEKIFGSNRHIAPKDGDDVHLFTVSASSLVHLDVSINEAVKAVNVFNGLSGAQLALTANSNIWKGHIDEEYKCVGEMFWDWWLPDSGRIGIPKNPFQDIEDYVKTIAKMSPVYVKRGDIPVGLPNYDSFWDYYKEGSNAHGINPKGKQVPLTAIPDDIDQHGTFYWFDARISRYYTLENRMNDQQPPADLDTIAALSLVILSALDEAEEELNKHEWEHLRQARLTACRDALEGNTGNISLFDLAWGLIDVAAKGLRKRGLCEEEYLVPLNERLKERQCPADQAERIYRKKGITGLIEERRL